MDIGYFGILVLMIASPFPPEVFMPLAGFMVAQGQLNFVYVVLAGLVGFLLSVLPWYVGARYLGEKRLRRLLKRHHWLPISPEKLDKVTRWFQRRGGQAILLSLLLPGMRNMVAIPAGISGMRLSTYLLYSTLAATFWLAVLTATGYLLGAQYYLVDQYLAPVYSSIIVVLGVAIGLWVVGRRFKRTAK